MAAQYDDAIDVVIINWNSGDHLKSCLDALSACRGTALVKSVIVVDNNSHDDSLDIEISSELRVRIHLPRPAGDCAGSSSCPGAGAS